jgi:hypothetical protein
MRSIRLNRRSLLRGAGVAVALPTLEAMLSDRGLLHGVAQAQAQKAPTRLVIFFFPNGLACPAGSTYEEPILDDWVPATTGAGYSIRSALEPLALYQDSFNILSGIDLKTGGVGGGHEWGTAGFATGVDNSPTGATGPSMEQVAAQHLGDATRFRSLVVSDNSVPPRYDVNLSHISYSAANSPVPPIRDPRELFDKLFQGLSPMPAGQGPSDLVLRRRSVLDFVKSDLLRLNGVLGSSDRQRLDAHLTGVRELERQLDLQSSAAAAACQPPVAPAVDGSKYSQEGENLMIDMTALALKCDLTRYASFMVSYGGSSGGPAPNQHALTHDRNREQCLPIVQLQVGFFARLLSRLSDDTAQEASGSVLDNSLLYLGSELSDGSAHSNNNLPIVLAGKAGGKVQTGRHIAYPKGTLVKQMLLAMLQLGDVPVTSFGGTSEPLGELTA